MRPRQVNDAGGWFDAIGRSAPERRGQVVDRGGQHFPTTQAEALAMLGVAFSHMWLFDNQSGNEADLIGTFDLTPTSGPTQGVVPPGGSARGVQFADSDANKMERTTAADLDVGLGSFLIAGYSTVDIAATTKQIAGKGSSPYLRISLINVGEFRFNIHDGVNQVNLRALTEHRGRAFPWLACVDRNVEIAYVRTPIGSAQGSSAAVGTLTTAATFSVGAGAANAAGANTQIVAFAEGAAAEGLDHAAIIAAMTDAMGIVGR